MHLSHFLINCVKFDIVCVAIDSYFLFYYAFFNLLYMDILNLIEIRAIFLNTEILSKYQQ